MMEKTLKVTGLSCKCCVNKVEESIKQLTGISSAEINYDREEVQVVFNQEAVTLKQIEGKIEEAGYQVG